MNKLQVLIICDGKVITDYVSWTNKKPDDIESATLHLFSPTPIPEFIQLTNLQKIKK